MLRAYWLLSLLGILLLTPALCIAGVTQHPCDCETGSLCPHESECLEDPCDNAEYLPTTVQPGAGAGAPFGVVEFEFCSTALDWSLEVQSCPQPEFLRERCPGAELPLLI